MTAEIESAAAPEVLVSLRLVPVEPFTGLCDHKDCTNPDHLGYGLSDAVEPWSDCNRANGRIYRVDDDFSIRREGESVQIMVRQADLPFFQRKFDEEFQSGDTR